MTSCSVLVTMNRVQRQRDEVTFYSTEAMKLLQLVLGKPHPP